MANSNYGFNILASDMANYNLSRVNQGGVRTWENLFKNAQLDYNTQAQLLQTDYSDAIATAYKANLERQNAIANRGYSAGYTNELLGANRQQLLDTYTQAMQSYAKGASTIQENYMQNVSTINEALMQQSTYQKLAQDSALDYVLSQLATAQRTQPGMVKDQVDTYNLYKDYGLDWIYTNEKLDEKGNIIEQSRLKDRQELLGEMYTDGQLNEKGKQLYDIAYNFQGTDYLTDGSATMNYLQWLSENTDKTYEGLYDWLGQADPYNYTLAGTNLGSVKQMLGLKSTDYEYNKYSYSTYKEPLLEKFKTNYDTILNNNGFNNTEFSKVVNLLSVKDSHNERLNDAKENAINRLDDNFKKVYNDLSKKTEKILGEKLYNEFKQEYKQLKLDYVEYTSLKDNLQRANSYKIWLEQYQKAVDKFVQDRTLEK